MNYFSVSFHDFAPEHGPGTGIQIKFCKKQNEHEISDYFVISVGGLMLFMNHERMKEWRDAMKQALHEDSEPRNESLELAEVRDALEKTRDTLEKERTASEFHIQSLINELRETRAALTKEGQRVAVIRKSEEELAERAKTAGGAEVYVSYDGFTRLPEAMRIDLNVQGPGSPAGESGGKICKIWFFKRLGTWEVWPEPKLEKLLADDEKSRPGSNLEIEALQAELKHVQELLEDAEADLAKERTASEHQSKSWINNMQSIMNELDETRAESVKRRQCILDVARTIRVSETFGESGDKLRVSLGDILASAMK